MPDPDTHTGADADTSLHPGPHVPERHADACPDEDPKAHGGSDPDADSHLDTDAERHCVGPDIGTDIDAAADGDADAVTSAGLAEPRTRRARSVRIGSDDRFGCVDLAPLPELSRIPAGIDEIRAHPAR